MKQMQITVETTGPEKLMLSPRNCMTSLLKNVSPLIKNYSYAQLRWTISVLYNTADRNHMYLPATHMLFALLSVCTEKHIISFADKDCNQYFIFDCVQYIYYKNH